MIVGFPDSSNVVPQTKVHCVRYSLVGLVQFPLSGVAPCTVTEGHVIAGDKKKRFICHYLNLISNKKLGGNFNCSLFSNQREFSQKKSNRKKISKGQN